MPSRGGPGPPSGRPVTVSLDKRESIALNGIHRDYKWLHVISNQVLWPNESLKNLFKF